MPDSEIGTLPVLDESEIDSYVDKDGFTRIRFSPRREPDIDDIRVSFEELLALTEGSLQEMSKNELIGLIMEWQRRIHDFKNQFHVRSVKGLPESPFGETLHSLSERVVRVMKMCPIRYSEDKRSYQRPEVIRNILFNLAIGNNLNASARLSGITAKTLREWRDADPEGIGAAVEAAKGLFAQVASTANLRLLIGGEVQLVEERHHNDGTVTRKVKRSLPDPRVAIKARTAVDAGGWTPTTKVDITHEFKLPTSKEDQERLREVGKELAFQKAQTQELEDEC